MAASSGASKFCVRVFEMSKLKPFTQCSASLVTAARRVMYQAPIRYASSSSGNQGNGDQQSQGRAPLKKPFTPVGKHDTQIPERHRDAEQQPLEAFPDDVNPETGEKGGPKGLEPTRYGDWERKGRCIDF